MKLCNCVSGQYFSFRLTGFSDFVHCPVFWKLEKDNSETESVSILRWRGESDWDPPLPPTPQDGNVQCLKHYGSYFIEYQTMDKVQNPNNSEYYTPYTLQNVVFYIIWQKSLLSSNLVHIFCFVIPAAVMCTAWHISASFQFVVLPKAWLTLSQAGIRIY
jgi:hypothetical protein